MSTEPPLFNSSYGLTSYNEQYKRRPLSLDVYTSLPRPRQCPRMQSNFHLRGCCRNIFILWRLINCDPLLVRRIGLLTHCVVAATRPYRIQLWKVTLNLLPTVCSSYHDDTHGTTPAQATLYFAVPVPVLAGKV